MSIADATADAIADAAATVTEGESLAFPVRLSHPSAVAITVAYTLAGTATAGDDYTDGGAGSVTFAAESTEATIALATVDDDADEPEETVAVTLTAPDPALATLGAPSTASAAIADDDLPVVTVAAAPDTVAEGADAVFVLTRAGVVSEALAVTFTVTDADRILVSNAPAGVTFAAGVATARVTLATRDDDVASEADDLVTLTLADGATWDLGAPSEAAVTVRDDDLPVVTVAAEADAVTEGADAVFTLTRTGEVSAALDVSIAVTEPGADEFRILALVVPPTGVRFGAGEAAVTLRLPTRDDLVDRPDGAGAVTVTLQADAAVYELGDPFAATVAVEDNDLPIVRLLNVGDPDLYTEGEDVLFRLTRTEGDLSQTLRVGLIYRDRDDALAPGEPSSVTFGVGEAEVTLRLPTNDDSDPGDKRVTVSLPLITQGYIWAGDRSRTVTVRDNDGDPLVTVAAGADVIAQGEAAAFTLTRTGNVSGALAVSFAVADADGVLASPAPAGVTFADGVRTAVLRLATREDALDRTDATLTLTLQSGTGYRLETPPGAATVTVSPVPIVTVAVVQKTIAEGANAAFTLTRTGDLSGALAVNVTIARSIDVRVSTTPPSSVSFGADEATVRVEVPTRDDDMAGEEDGFVSLNLRPGADYRLLGPLPRVTVTVLDDDAMPEVSVAAAGSVTEGGALAFPVTLSRPFNAPIPVDWTLGGTATAGDDHDGSASGTVTFAPGEVRTELSFVTVDDDADEAEETVEVTLTAPDPALATLGTATAAGRIRDDDLPVVTVGAQSDTVTEGAAAVFILTRAGVPSERLTVTFAVTGGGAVLAGAPPTEATFGANRTAVRVTLATDDDGTDEADAALTLTLQPGAGRYRPGDPSQAMVTVRDDDAEPTLSIADAAAVTEGGTLAFPVTLSGPYFAEIMVDYTLGGTAAAGDDYTDSGTGTLTFAPREVRKVISLATVDDSADEPEERVEVTLSLPDPPYPAMLKRAMAAGRILDGDGASAVTVAAAADTVVEGADAVFTLMRADGDLSHALTVAVTVTDAGAVLTGTAPAGVTFDANEATATLRLATDDDSVVEADATLTLTLTAGGAYSLGTPSVATVTVRDDDGTPTVSIAAAGSVTEGGTLAFPVTLSGPFNARIAVPYTLGGAATAGDDYTDGGAGAVTFAPGAVRTVISLATVDDRADEPDETVAVTLAAGASWNLDPSPQATGTITDDDPPVVTVAAVADAVAEGADAVFTLTRAGVVSATLTVTVAVTDADAVLATAAPDRVTFGAGEATATLRLGTQDDTDAGERDAALTLTVQQPADDAAYAPGEPSRVTVTVRDDDAMPEVSVAAAGSVTEGGALAFPVTLNGPFNAPIAVAYTLGGAATAGADYAGSASGTVTFAAKTTRETISLQTLADKVDEPDETVAVTLSPPDPALATLGTPSTAEGTIIDGDLPVVTVVADETAVTEGEDALFTLTREGVVSDELEVAYAFRIARDAALRSLRDGGAFGRAADEQNAATVTFEAGQSTVQVRRPTPDDDIDGADRTFVLWLVSGAGDRLGDPSWATMTVQDDEVAPAVTIADADAVTEGGTLAFPVRLSHPSETPIPVAYTLAGQATANDDYTDAGAGTVTFPAGETERTISLVTVDDREDELGETVEVALVAPDPALATLGTPSRATGRIEDNEGLSVVTVAAEADEVTEGEDAVFTLTRAQGDASRALEVSVTVTDADGVLASTAPASVTFGAGAATATLRLGTDDDETDEPGATLTLTLADGDDYDLGTPSEATVTVQDNDATPRVTLVLTPTSIAEAGGVSTVTATLDRPSSAATTVTVSAAPDSPAVASDYTLSTNRVLTVAAGATGSTGVVTITAVDNAVDAPDKTVRVSATATNSHRITAPRVVLLTIMDDDGSGLSIDDASVAEGDSGGAAMQFTVTLDQALTDEVTVDWATADGTATAGTDYTARNGSLTFDAGDTSRTVTVTVTGDTVDEPNETFTVALTNAVGAMIAKATGTGTITDDDDTPTVTLILTPDTITEAGGVSTVTASLNHPSSEATTVTVTVTPVTPAVAGDYTLSANRVLTVAAGATTSTGAVTITAVDNDVQAPDKTVTVSATATNTHRITAPQDVTLTITDNAAPAGTLTVDDTTPVVGETLTADTSGIADADGLTGATFRYRWVRVAAGGVETEVGTGQSYTVVAADVGATLKVEVTYTDDGGTEETVASAVTAAAEAAIFDANRRYGVTTRYRQTTTVDLTEYLATGVASSAVTFAVDDCGATSSDFYRSVTLSGGTLSLVSNELGHTHGDRTETATECVVTATMAGDSAMRTFSFRIVPPRALLTVQTPEVSVVGQYDDALEVRVRDPSGLGSSWLRLAWRETGTSAWEDRIMSGASLGSASPPVIRIAGLESGTSYTVQAVVLTREAFDYYANGRAIAERVLTELASGLDGKWIANMPGGGQSRRGRAEGTTTNSVPAFLRASVNGIVLTVTMDQGLDEASVPAASAFTVSDVGGVGMRTVRTVTVSGAEVTLTVSPAVGAGETVTVSYAVPGSGPVLQDVDGNAAEAFTDQPVANETPTVTLVLTPASIGENGGVSTVTATLDKPSPQVGTVMVAAVPVSPAVAGDYTLSGSRLTIAANSLTSTGTVTITANDNDVDAPDKTVTVTATLTNTQGVSGPDDTTLTIEDDEATPTVTLVLTPASIGENGGVSTVTATLDHASSEATTVTVTATPESPAVAGDYTLSGSRLTIAAGETTSTGTVTISAVNNPVHEGDKTVTVSATATNSYGITAPQDVALTIEEDEVLPVVSIDDASVDEGDTGSTTLEFTVRLDRTAREPARVDWATADGSATAGTDYRAGTGTLMFAGGDSSKTVTVSVTGDEVDERDETFTVTLTNPSSLTLGDDTATGTIVDDDDPTVTLVLTPDTIGEAGGVSTVTATLDRASSQATTVTVTATPESPAVAGDYTLSGSRLTIAANSLTSTGTVTITAVDNAVHAADKAVTVSATAENAQGITAPQDVTLTITDDDNAAPTGAPTIDDTTPVVGETLTADPSGIGDADGLTGATFTWQWVRVSGGTETPIAGATTASYTVVDADVGATLKVAASFTDDGGTAETVESAETAAVLDDDDSPTTGAVTITGTPAEGETLTADTSGLADADGLDNAAYAYQWVRTPAGGSDEDISGATSQTYVPVFADVGATLEVRVTVTDDRNFQATLTSAPTAAVAALPRPVVTVASDGDVTEGSPALFTLTRTGDTAQTLDVAYEVTATGDFGVTTGAGTASFPANDATVQVSVATTGDDTHEAHGSVTVTLTADTGADPAYLLGDPATAMAAVEDDDNAAPTGAPTIDDTTPVEGQTLTADPSGIGDADGLTGATFTWQWVRVSGGTDTPIAGATTASYTVVAGDVGATLKVAASFTDDGGTAETVESAETATVEALPEVTVASDGDVTEGSAAVFTLTRTGATVGTLDVAYEVTASGDFGVTTGAATASFPANGATVQVSVPTTGDGTHEAHGSVTVTLQADAAYELGTDAAATAAVEDDDDSPTTGTVTITGTPTEGETLTADTSGLSDADGLANAGYAWQWVRTPSGGSDADISGATSQTYVPVFADVGATLKVKVEVTDDEGHQATFTSAPTSVVAALPRPSVTVASDGDVTEGSPALFTLTRTGDTAGPLDVDYEVTATGDFGVTPFEATFAFLANNATVQVSVPTTGDGAHEAHGSVTVTLQADTSADPAYLLGDPATATAAVRDDDNAAPTGAPTIDDTTPVVGETLAADPSGIGDADGLTGATFTWQWVRVSGGTDTPIAGATTASYTVVAGDVGATLKVAASFTDDGGTQETVESAETATVAATPRPRVAVAPVASPVAEGADAQFRVTRTVVTAGALTVRYSVSESGAMVASGEEGAKSVDFGDGDTEQTVTVPTEEDTGHEADSVVTMTLTADAAYDLGTATAEVTVEDDDNAAPTGAPTIDDTTPVVGETLAADPSGIGDADGLTGATFTWRWLRVASGGAETEVGTGSSYTVVAGDVGSTLKVEASFTDDDGTAETVESAETATVEAAPVLPEVTVASDGDVTEGSPAVFTLTRTGDTAQTLDVDYEVTATGDFGVTPFEATFAFLANNATVQVSVATTGDATHEAQGSVTLTLTADTSADPAYLLGDPSTATAAVEDDDDSPTTGTVTITGTPTEGETLTADTSGLTDADGLDNATWAYQWVRTPSGGSDENISGATSQTYVPVFADAGATLEVRVTVTDDEGHEATFTSAPTAAVAALPRPEVTVASDGDVTEGSPALFTLTRTGDTAGTLDVAYEVTASGDFGVTTGAATASFPANGSTVQVSVATTGDATHEAHGSVTLTLTADTSADPAYLLGDPATATAAVRDDDNAAPTGAPTIDDTTPVVGETLTADPSDIADPDGLTGATFTWQWIRVASGGTETRISGATTASYTVVAGDMGATLKVEASFTDDDGTAETVESAETSVVAAAPRPTVSVAPVASPVTEGAGAQFRVKRTVVTAGALTVRYRVSETGAMVASGEEGAKSVAFADGDTEKTVTVPTVEDTGHEADSTVTLTLTPDAAYDLGTASAEVTVEDDDNAAPTGAPTIDDTTPVVGETLTADPSGIADPDGLTGATFTWRWVRVSGGTDTPIAGATTASYTVAAGDVGSTLKVAASFTDDDGTAETVESAETATVALPMLSIGDASVDEGDSGSVTLNFTVTLSHAATDTVTVEWATADGTATAGTDYTAGSGRLTFNTGDSSRTVFVTVASDDVDEPDETFTVMLSNPSGATIEDGAATGTIRDGDDEPKVTLIVTPNPLHENGGVSTVTARLDRASSEATTVTVSVTPVAPTVEDNYEVSDNLELRIAAGATTSTGRVTITGVNNREHSPNKEISVSGTAVNSQGVTDPDPVTLALFDDDGPPSVTLHLTPDSITENGGLSTVTARQSRRSGADTTITVSAAPVAPAVAGDYTLSADLVLTVAAGETESTGTVTVTAVNNSVYEGDKQVTVSGTAENALGILGDPRDVTLTITDDENPPLELSIGDASVDEGDSGSTTLDFTVTLDRTATETVTVDWETSDGTATAGTDYTAGNGTLTFSIGDSSKTVSVTVAGDNVDEPNETFTVTLSNASSGATIGDGTATGTITDDDATPKVTLLLSPDTIDEDGGTATLTASLDRPSSEDTTVEGIGGVNFEAFYTVGPGPNPVLTIPAGETASTGTVTLTAVANNVDAPDRRITVSAEASNGLGVTSPDNVTLTIEDDDDAPTVTLHLSPETISEAGGTSSATASLSHPSGVETTVTVTVVPVSPAVAGDYRLSSNVVLTIVAGEMDSTGTVTVTAVDNDVDAPDKEVTVWATTANAHSGSVLDSAPLTIEDDDATPTVTLVLTPNSVAEAGGTSTVTASLDRTSSEVTTVTVSASPVPPAVASDYTLSANLELRIAAGATESEGRVTITAVDNDEVLDRRVTVSGTAMNDHEVTGPRDVTLTIADDDGRELSIDDADVAEGGSGDSATLEFTVTLTPAATVEVTVDWETADGTAQAGTDYTAGSGRLTFGAGETGKTVSVLVAGNGVDEPDKTVTVTLSNASGAVLGEATGTGTIVDDDDAPTVTLVLTPTSIVENGGVSTVTARLDHPSSEATTVTVSAAPVTPATANDYTLSAHRVLTVAAGATTSTGAVTVTGVDNDVEAPDRRVTVSGTARNGQGVTGPRDVTLTIVDDESVDERHRRLEYALASFGRTVAQDLVTVIEDREWLASAGTTATLAGTPLVSFRSEEAVYGALQRYVGPDGDRVGTAALRELLSRSSFQLSLGDEGEGEAGGPRAGSLVLWGRGSQSWSRGRLDAAVATRGEMLSGQLGLEYRLREDMLLGVMVNASNGALDFDEALATEVEAELVSVHPYAQWSPRQGLRGWAMLGYGVGEAALADSFSALTGTDIETDIEMVMAAAGGSHEVASRWGFDWSLGTNGFLVQLDADEREGLPAAVQSEVWQMRLLLEGSAGKELDGGSGLSGNVELAARVDGGDAEAGLGMELGGGVAYGHLNLGIDVRASGRVLLSHEDGLEDAGMSLALEVDPGERGRGLYFALAPSWGNTTSGARAMWEGRQASTGGPHGPDGQGLFDPKMRLDSELGYTTPLPTRRGALTSYGAFSSDGGATRQYRVGRRLELAHGASMSLEAERRERAGAAPEHGIRLKGSIRF